MSQVSKYEKEKEYILNLLRNVHKDNMNKVDETQVDVFLKLKDVMYELMERLDTQPAVINQTVDPKKTPVLYQNPYFKTLIEAKRSMETSIKMLGLTRELKKSSIELSSKEEDAPDPLDIIRGKIKSDKENGSI
jgi:hypothetical protein